MGWMLTKINCNFQLNERDTSRFKDYSKNTNCAGPFGQERWLYAMTS